MDELQKKPTLPVLRLMWRKTTAPRPPVSLPTSVRVDVTDSAIEVHVKKSERHEELDLQFHKDEIVGVDIVLMPEVPDNASGSTVMDVDGQWVLESYLSYAVIKYRDPFDVVPFFENTFTSSKAYWLKALAKGLKERLGLEPEVTEGDPTQSDAYWG